MALAGGQVSDPALENRSFTSGRRWRRGGLFDPERDHAGAAATLGGTVRSEARERTGQRRERSKVGASATRDTECSRRRRAGQPTKCQKWPRIWSRSADDRPRGAKSNRLSGMARTHSFAVTGPVSASTPMCSLRHDLRRLVPCFSTNHSPAPHSFRPVLSTNKCTGTAPEGECTTCSFSARRLKVE